MPELGFSSAYFSWALVRFASTDAWCNLTYSMAFALYLSWAFVFGICLLHQVFGSWLDSSHCLCSVSRINLALCISYFWLSFFYLTLYYIFSLVLLSLHIIIVSLTCHISTLHSYSYTSNVALIRRTIIYLPLHLWRQIFRVQHWISNLKRPLFLSFFSTYTLG